MQEQLCHISSSIWKYFLNINKKQIYIYVWPNCWNCCSCCWGSHLNELLIEGTNRGKWLLIRIYHNQLKRSVFRSVVYAFKEFLKKLKYKFSSKSETIGTKAAAFWQIIIEYLEFLFSIKKKTMLQTKTEKARFWSDLHWSSCYAQKYRPKNICHLSCWYKDSPTMAKFAFILWLDRVDI